MSAMGNNWKRPAYSIRLISRRVQLSSGAAIGAYARFSADALVDDGHDVVDHWNDQEKSKSKFNGVTSADVRVAFPLWRTGCRHENHYARGHSSYCRQNGQANGGRRAHSAKIRRWNAEIRAVFARDKPFRS
jgi:hypothetical protein